MDDAPGIHVRLSRSTRELLHARRGRAEATPS